VGSKDIEELLKLVQQLQITLEGTKSKSAFVRTTGIQPRRKQTKVRKARSCKNHCK